MAGGWLPRPGGDTETLVGSGGVTDIVPTQWEMQRSRGFRELEGALKAAAGRRGSTFICSSFSLFFCIYSFLYLLSASSMDAEMQLHSHFSLFFLHSALILKYFEG